MGHQLESAVEMNWEQVEVIDHLANIVASLPKQDNIFAGKMIEAFDRFGKLTERQFDVVQDILARNSRG